MRSFSEAFPASSGMDDRDPDEAPGAAELPADDMLTFPPRDGAASNRRRWALTGTRRTMTLDDLGIMALSLYTSLVLSLVSSRSKLGSCEAPVRRFFCFSFFFFFPSLCGVH